MKYSISLVLLLALNIFQGHSQCKNFVKEECLSKVAPFVFSGTQNTLTLSSKEQSKVTLVFNAGQTYRLLVCAQKQLGVLQFRLLDLQGNLIFDSKAHRDTDFWDFKTDGTMQVVVEITVPPSADGTKKTGCVAVVVGIKPLPKELQNKK